MNQFPRMARAIVSSIAYSMACSIIFVPLSATAQSTVTDPGAKVPPVVYQSVFNQSPVGVETKSVDWIKANAEVGQFKRGHVDILKWEESRAKDKSVSKAEGMAKPTPDTKPDGKPLDSSAPKAATMPAMPAQPSAASGGHKH